MKDRSEYGVYKELKWKEIGGLKYKCNLIPQLLFWNVYKKKHIALKQCQGVHLYFFGHTWLF